MKIPLPMKRETWNVTDTVSLFFAALNDCPVIDTRRNGAILPEKP